MTLVKPNCNDVFHAGHPKSRKFKSKESSRNTADRVISRKNINKLKATTNNLSQKRNRIMDYSILKRNDI